MIKTYSYSFTTANKPTLAQVGGKGLSLIEGVRAGLPVPPGFVLTVDFFEPWLEKLKKTAAWNHFLNATDKTLPFTCNQLKKQAMLFSLNEYQKRALQSALRQFGDDTLFAVRSSSPNEDLEGASFAGGYESILGVTRTKLEEAIKQAFASCLDVRVVLYKKENGFDTTDPTIAVIIQQQIASEVAGVGFSLNPVSNNYDEAVFTANWGLGETVVAGVVTPDTFTVDKVNLQVKERVIGGKETSIWLTHSGGTKEKADPRHSESCLSEEQVLALTKLIIKVEKQYAKPIDIEWAYAKGELFLLQARPVTAYVPLAPEMMTKPGAKKRLYFDVTVTAEGMNKPVSYLSTSMFRQLIKNIGNIIFLRDITTDFTKTIPWVSEGKIFANLSNAIALVGKEKVAHAMNIMDPLSAKILEQLDEDTYKANTPRALLAPVGLFLRLPRILLFLHNAGRNPEQMHKKVQQDLQTFEEEARSMAAQDVSLRALIDQLIIAMFLQVFQKTVPLFIYANRSLSAMKKIAGKEHEAEFVGFDRSLLHNVTTEMGLALFHTAQFLPTDLDEKTFAQKIVDKQMPAEFLIAWEEFITKYGMRGPAEIDLAAPRYADDPTLLLSILVGIKKAQGKNAQEIFDDNQKKREKAYEKLYEQVLLTHPKDAKAFARHYKIFTTFGGYRETHKYYLIFINYLLRQRILKEAEALVAAGRLDSIEQVFDLTIDQLDQARTDAFINLPELAKNNTVFLKRLEKVSRPPTLIDSRGFIPRPVPTTAHKGEVVGMPVSAGIVRGKIKVLHTPTEKPFHKGEILVARSTDPGWTPLFINAAGVILEIGGMLQHGALVAREYGLPCVAAVAHATELWKDGTEVEIDGSTGIIRTIKSDR